MKKVGTFTILIFLLINCQEPKNPLVATQFSKTVGQRISLSDASRWTDRYTSSVGKTQTMALDVETMQNVLLSSDSHLGAIFHHATDNNGQHHILCVPVEEGTSVWNTSTVIDIGNGIVETSIAQGWAERYKNENPNDTWFHFFGIHLLQNILTNDALSEIQLIPGIDDENRAQLLLYVWTSSGDSAGREAGEDVAVFDKSTSCPTHCDVN